MREHTRERPHKCGYCGKTFSWKHNLGVHMKIHNGAKPYLCDYCDKAFLQNSNFKLHLRKHTWERPHKCSYCEKVLLRNIYIENPVAKNYKRIYFMLPKVKITFKAEEVNKSWRKKLCVKTADIMEIKRICVVR